MILQELKLPIIQEEQLHLPIFSPEDHKIKSEEYTCYNCNAKDTCEYAWDDYNTNEDCLAEK